MKTTDCDTLHVGFTSCHLSKVPVSLKYIKSNYFWHEHSAGEFGAKMRRAWALPFVFFQIVISHAMAADNFPISWAIKHCAYKAFVCKHFRVFLKGHFLKMSTQDKSGGSNHLVKNGQHRRWQAWVKLVHYCPLSLSLISWWQDRVQSGNPLYWPEFYKQPPHG